MYEELKSHGVTADTPKNIMLGAGTIHKGLKYIPATTGENPVAAHWNFTESLIGATSGGNKLSIVPEIKTVEVDGALVKVKGLDLKQGETAKLETNLIEITPEILKTTVIGQLAESDIEGYSLIESKPDIEAGDYYENLAFVGKKTDGTPIIIILDNALCTSGFEGEGKNKDATIVKCTFECYQEATGDLSILPYHIYYPTTTVAQG
jgi:hypothetical protein